MHFRFYPVETLPVSVSEGRRFSFYVYSLQTRCWRLVIESFLPPAGGEVCATGTYLGGVIHWKVTDIDISHSDGLERTYLILTCNLADEVCGRIPIREDMPRGELNRDCPMTIKLHGKDCLSTFVSHFDGTFNWVYLWVMEEYGAIESWREVLKIRSNYISFIQHVRMNGEFVIQSRHDSLLSGSIKNNEYLTLCCSPRLYMGTYVDSLVVLGLSHEALEEIEALRGD